MDETSNESTATSEDGAKKRKGGQNLVASTGSHGRRDLLQFYPWEVTLVIADKNDLPPDVRMLVDAGFLTVLEDSSHVLFHRKVNRPVKEDTVRTIAPEPEGEGQIHNIKVVRDGPSLLVGVGRGRTKAIAMRNYRLCQKAGKSRDEMAEAGLLQLIGTTIARGDDRQLWRMVQAENAQREDSTRMEMIRDAWRGVQSFGVPEKEAARVLSVDVPQLRQKFKILDLAVEVQNAVDSGEVSEHLAYTEFVKWSKKDQVKHLQEMRDAGMLKGQAAKVAAEQIRKGEKPTKSAAPGRRAPNKKKLLKWVEELKEPAQTDKCAKWLRIGYMVALGMQVRGLDEKEAEKLNKWREG